MIAATIVNKATHARLDNYRIGYEESLRARVEGVCFRREIAFAAKLPDGAVVREQAERSLKYYANAAHWTDAAFDNRALAEIPEAPSPAWRPTMGGAGLARSQSATPPPPAHVAIAS